MITLTKLSRLPEGTRERKCARILEDALQSLAVQKDVDKPFVTEVCMMVARSQNGRIGRGTRMKCLSLVREGLSSEAYMWNLADAVHLLHVDLGVDRADWDFTEPSGGALDRSHRITQPFTVVIDRLRSPFNVGSVFRTADSFGVRQMLLVNPTASPNHPRAVRSARGCTETVLWRCADVDEIVSFLSGIPVFALETGGIDLDRFAFPREGAVVIGSEELGVGPELLALADRSLGRVGIPLAGSKGSLNVSVAFGILMHAWHADATESQQEG